MVIRMVIEGSIYAVVLSLIVTISQFYNPRLWLNCYPKAIQDVVPERTKAEMRAKMLVGIPFILIMFGYPVVSTFILKSTMGANYNFFYGLLNMVVISTFFNLFDLFILDWLVFSSIKPKYLRLKGTEGMKEYSDYLFHAKAALKGFIITLVFSIIVSLITLI